MKRLISLFMVMLMLCPVFSVTASAKGASKSSATKIAVGTTYESYLSKLETEWYSITPDETQYYRFCIRNQSVESRTGIGAWDSLSNMWNGYIEVVVKDSREDILSEFSVRCGYEAQISLNLQQGKTYYITCKSNLAPGNYWLKTEKLNDLGANTFETAIDVLSNGQIVSAVDASDDEDWFTFTAEQERAYYTFNLENIAGSSSISLVLYQRVAGAGTTPGRKIKTLIAYSDSSNSFDLQLEEGAKYYYCISGGVAGYVLDVTMQLDAAGASRNEAYDVALNEAYISSLDGTDDVDYYRFETGSDPAYYHVDIENLTGEYHNAWIYSSLGDAVDSVSGSRAENMNQKLDPESVYYLALKGDLSNYKFSITEKKDAYADVLDDASVISFAKEYKSSFDGTDDRDYVKFTTGSTGAYYHIEAKNLTGKDMYAYLLDSNGNDVTYRSYGSSAAINEKLTPNTTYYILFKGGNSDYSFKLTEKKDVYSDVLNEAAQISLNKEYKSAFDGTDDRDYVKFTTGSTGAYYHLEAKNLTGKNMYAYLLDANGNDVTYRSYGSTAAINEKLTPNTTYYILFKGDKSDYTFKVTEKKDAYSDEISKATAISLNKEYKSAFEGDDDKDYVKFTTDSSEAYYHIETKNITGKWFYTYLLDASGNDIAYDAEVNNYINEKLAPNTTYYLLFKGSNSDYSFKVTEKKDTYPDEMSKATKVSVGKQYSTSFDGTNDRDYVRFTTGSSNAYYNLKVEKLSGSSFDFWLTDADGNDIVSGSDYYSSKTAKLNPNTSYYILFKGSNTNYKFKITQKVDVEPDEKEGAKAVSLNSMKKGSLQASDDVDWFRVNISSEGNYRLRLVNNSGYTMYINLYNGDEEYKCGMNVYSSEGSNVVYLEPGAYYVRVNGNSSGSYSFVLATCGDGHKETYTYPSKSTMSNDGQRRATCSKCGVYIETTKVAKIETATLSKTAYTYDGKVKAPTVTVKDSEGKRLRKDKDFKLTYEKGRKNPGKYTVRIDFIGKYSGTKRLYFTIAPKATSKVTAVQSAKAIKLTWSKVTGADGYRVYQYNPKTKTWDKIKTLKDTSFKVEKLKAGTTYKFRIKAYKKDGGTIWGNATSAITVATKPAAPKITKLTATKGGAVLAWSDVSGESGYQVYYSTKKNGDYKKLATYKANVVKGSKSKLKSGKTYYFRVRAYKTVGDSIVYSAWSAVKGVKIK